MVAGFGIGTAPWAMVFLTSWCLLWHLPLLRERGPWQWYDVLCTVPILFFWVGQLSRMLPQWSFWQKGLPFLVLWLSLWGLLVRKTDNTWLAKASQLFWPASLTVLMIIGSVHLKVSGTSRFGLWFFGTLGLSLGMGRWASRISPPLFLCRWWTIAGVFAAYGLCILVQGSPAQLEEAIDTALLHLFNSLDLLWWVVGAGMILSVRGLTLMLLKWIQALLNKWILPLSAWVIPLIAYGMGWLSVLIARVSKESVAGLCAVFALGATVLAWRRKEAFLREWMFWGFFLFFLFQQYHHDVNQTIHLYWNKAAVGGMGFVTLAAWLLCLNYYSVGKYLSRFREKEKGIGVVALMGAVLWLMVGLLWMSYVDQQLSAPLRGQIHFHLLKGLTFLGIPLIIYHLIMGQYLRKDLPGRLPWPQILMIGLGLTQVLQAVEHLVVTWFERLTLDALQKILLDALLAGVPSEDAIPAWVMNPYWVFVWRAFRCGLAMPALTWVLRRRDRGDQKKTILVLTFCFASLAVWTAEALFLYWPSLPLEWAVILRPWVETSLMWDWSFLRLYFLYLLGGLLWGWGFVAFLSPDRHRS